MSDLTVFTLRLPVVEECVNRGCKKEERTCAQTSQVSLVIKASCLCLQICSMPACCGLFQFSFCKGFILCSITKDRIQSYLKKNKQKNTNKSSLIQPVLHYTDKLLSRDLELVHHIQFLRGLLRRLNYMNCIHCAIEHLGGKQQPVVGYRSHMALSVKSITVTVLCVVFVSIHSLY